jgi:hypothetical protein
VKQLAKPSGEERTGSVSLIEPQIDPDQVRQQLERLIGNPLFSQSRRYSNLLRYVVEETLDGRAGRLKERTVGIDVFGREPSYDTTVDPVVRTTAAQLRHRIAQYYSRPEHENEMRIGLPPGAYVPEFLPAAPIRNLISVHVEVAETVAEPSIAELVVPETPARSRKWMWQVLIAAALIATVAVSFNRYQTSQQDVSLRKFWGPVWDSSKSVLLCIGGGQAGNRQTSQPVAPNTSPAQPDAEPTVTESLRANSVAWPDAMVTAELAGLARASGQNLRFRKSGLIAFADLRESPDVLVGGFNNQWIMRLDSGLRYRYVRDRDADWSYIEDQKNPSRRDWGVHFRQPYSSFLVDYGVITRVLDPSTEKMVVIASGIASYGTMAAGDFLTQEKYMKILADRAPKGWEHQNMQVVFSTEVISGNAGPPRILATWFW